METVTKGPAEVEKPSATAESWKNVTGAEGSHVIRDRAHP